ncbi:MAG: alkaline phosphatase D family protein [Crocinitomicaceae bacterium]|jgi:alkaline phosphatase D
MKNLFYISFLLFSLKAFSQTSVSPLDCIAPFYHGVASGDPLTDRVIIWTRVTPHDFNETLTVNYKVATDNSFTSIVAQGNAQTDASKDFTVKVDVTGLSPNTFYFYEFEFNGSFSAVGRTKTLPVGDVENVRFAVVSCANLEAGYFNVYSAINERNDVDAVLMLGDYIYEYASGGYSPNSNIDRVWEPEEEIIDLAEYRLRYSSYHMDNALRKLHQNFPWICVWDDHETANNSFVNGAENHTSDEGDWFTRKENGKRAFFEWLPIRPKAPENTQIFRSFKWGNLANLIMLDTRLEGRDEQVPATDPAINDTNRTILGDEQFTWLKDELSLGTQQWKILGNQVMMGEITALGNPINTDGWDGYPAERQRIYDHLTQNNINNFVVATGDIHTSWAINLENGNTPVGVEFVTPSVTSPGVPLNVGGLLSFENPHLKYVELTKKGFVILDVSTAKVQGDWYYVTTIDQQNLANTCQKSYYSNAGNNTLVSTNTPSVGHGPFSIPLSEPCSRFASIEENELSSIIGVYPNPSDQLLYIQTNGKLNSEDNWKLISSQGSKILIKPISVMADQNNVVVHVFDVSMFAQGQYELIDLSSKGKTRVTFVKN